MGILAKNSPPPAAARSSPPASSGFATSPADHLADPLAAAYAKLPAPPAPCPTCHAPMLWLDRYRHDWHCPVCDPPALPILVIARVTLVDVAARDPFGPTDETNLVEDAWATQWDRFRVERHRGRGEKSYRRVVTTSPIRCAANRNILADYGDAADSSGEKTGNKTPRFTIDESLGPPIGAEFGEEHEAWWRQSNILSGIDDGRPASETKGASDGSAD